MTDSPTSQAMHLAMTELKERERRIAELEDILRPFANLAEYSGLVQDMTKLLGPHERQMFVRAFELARCVLNKENGGPAVGGNPTRPVDLCCGFPVGGPCPGCPESPQENDRA